jgi:hypothetical protein
LFKRKDNPKKEAFVIDDVEATYEKQTIHPDSPLHTEEKTRVQNKLMQVRVMEPNQKEPILTNTKYPRKPEESVDCVPQSLDHYLFW